MLETPVIYLLVDETILKKENFNEIHTKQNANKQRPHKSDLKKCNSYIPSDTYKEADGVKSMHTCMNDNIPLTFLTPTDGSGFLEVGLNKRPFAGTDTSL